MDLELSGENRVVLPKSLISDIVSELHSGVGCAHHSFDKTLMRVRARDFWMGMTRDVRLAVRLCPA